jgi:XTP/dITP diphosphohydrolase
VNLLLATHNEHKRREFARLLGGASSPERDGSEEGARSTESGGSPEGGGSSEGYVLGALPDGVQLPPEDGATFAENALGKARAAAAAMGTIAIADDSGIEAAALGGAPGVRSARYAGEDASDVENLEKLLREAPVESALEYVCALAFVDPMRGIERVFEGRCAGRLSDQTRGERGFGYDPAFLPDDGPAGLTMAELSDAQKDAISHRGHAVRALLLWLAADGEDRGTSA